jgi:hypothetical protein
MDGNEDGNGGDSDFEDAEEDLTAVFQSELVQIMLLS